MRILTLLGLAGIFALSCCVPVQAQFSQPLPTRRVTEPIDEARLVTLPGHIHPAAIAENDRGPVGDSEPLGHIVLILRRSAAQQRELDAFVDRLHNPRLPQYHQWLTPSDFGQRFGPADEDVAAVAAWLKTKGFVIEDIPSSRTHITFTGTAGQMRDGFHVDIHNLSVHGEAHQAAMNDPEIPAALAPVVAGFRQLHDFFPTPGVKDPGAFQTDLATGKTTRILQPGETPDLTGSFNGSEYYAVGPQDFYTIYDENPLLKAGVTGAGVTIAVIERTQIVKADVTTFRSAFGLPAYPAAPTAAGGGVNYIYGASTGIGGDAACTTPPVPSSGNADQPEASLDVEWAGAVAPNATIDFVACGKKGSGLGSSGIEIAAEHIANYLASSITAASLSYGECESQAGSATVAYFSNLWEQYAAEGITAVVSSGDSGPDRCDQTAEAAGNAPSINAFSGTPYNVSAGGTDFSDAYLSSFYTKLPASTWWNPTNGPGSSSAKSYVPEKAWGGRCSDPLYDSYLEFTKNTTFGTNYTPQGICFGAGAAQENQLIGVSGGGGGVSIYNPIPTWQSAYGVGLYSGSTKFRNIPDIALFAAPGFWGHLLEFCDSDRAPCDYSPTTGAFKTSGAGGTSFVAPQVAGLFALIAQKYGSRLGQADYTLYNLAAQEYGTPAKPNTANLAECSGSAKGAEVGSACIFRDIAADTPSLQGGVIASATLQPCFGTIHIPDCYDPDSATNPWGISSVPGDSASTLAYFAGAGYDLTTGLGSLNIANLVAHWNTTSPSFPSTTTLVTSATSVSGSSQFTLTATVKAVGRGGAVAPAGKVEFFLGATSGTRLGYASLAAACTGTGDETACVGTTKIIVPAGYLDSGANKIVAYFEGDAANDAPSLSPAVIVTSGNKAQALTFTGLPAKATYNATPIALKAIAGASGNPVAFTIVYGPAVVKGADLYLTGAGTVIVAANELGNATYAAAPQVTQTITVAKAVLTVTAKNASRLYGAPNPAFGDTLTGFLGVDTAATTVTGAASLTTTATAASLPGNYPITAALGSLASANYTFLFKPGILTVTPKGTVALPTFKPAAGTYSTAQSVTIADTTPGSTIFYTTNGTAPSTSSTKYTGAISVKVTETIEAIAVATGYTSSAVAPAKYTIATPAAAPVFSVPTGTYSAAQSVQISDTTPGATIYYTTNGAPPTPTSAVYKSAVTVSTTGYLQAIAVANGYTTSPTASALYSIGANITATPVLSPPPGAYGKSQTVAITDSTAGAVITYSVGIGATVNTFTYKGPFSVDSTQYIAYDAIAPGFTRSAALEGIYTIGAVPTPQFSPPAGTYPTAQAVNIYDITPGATIYYTTDGTVPTTTSPVYNVPVIVPANQTIRAFAATSGLTSSAPVSSAYIIGKGVATPTFSLAPGSYSAAQSVAITDITPNATIYYTTNGAAPTTVSAKYVSPIGVATTETLKAIAAATGDTNSAVASSAYTIGYPIETFVATSSGTNVITLPVGGSGAFAVATENQSGQSYPSVTVKTTTGANSSLPVQVTLCQTNPSTGQCLSAPAPTVTLAPFAAGATPTFSIFVTATAAIASSPSNQVVVLFTGAGGTILGSASVLVVTN